MIQRRLLTLGCALLPWTSHASFIEATMGTAVVNDATATFHNPAALTLTKKPQIIGIGTKATSFSQFTGQTIESPGSFMQSGSAKDRTNYTLPSAYAALPIHEKLKLGLAVLSDSFSSDLDEPSILRYLQSNNQIKNIDYIVGLGGELNETLSLGWGFTYTSASFNSTRIIGFPNLGAPDSESHNKTKDESYGWNVGLLFKPFKSTLIGLNYRSRVSYQFTGTSEFEGPPAIISPQYHFNFWTPARGVLTLSHFITKDLGFIGSVQRIQWSVFKQITMHGLATAVGGEPRILPEVNVPYHFRDTWLLTVGGIKKITSKWVLRIAATYSQSPGNGLYRLSAGDDYILGASTGYNINKNLILDAGYAHAFTQSKNINITTQRNRVFGINKGYRDSGSIKVTLMLD